jgi:cytochrome c-type biogenesis protein CcmH/NrfF
MRLRIHGWAVAAVLAITAPGAAWSQPPPAPAPVAAAPAGSPDEAAAAEARVLFREVMSPFCPGLTLADCPSPNAFTMRGDIERRLKAGESRETVLAELVQSYGTQVLADPSGTPIGSIVWGVPFAISLLAAIGLAFFLRRATRAHGQEPTAAPAESAQLRSRVDDELAAMD